MSSGTAMFGGNSNFSSIPTTAKSPKSPKGTIIENPLMKNAHQFSYAGSSLTTQRMPSALQAMPRSPLMAMTPNRDNIQQDYKATASQIATPGPPPKMSLSLMSGMSMPMQPAIAEEKDMKQKEQRYDIIKTPTMVSTPVPVASPPLLEKKDTTETYFKESSSNFSSESLVADHWVIAHGYTSSNEYRELMSILSSCGTIQSQEAGGNWVAVLYESRLAADRALHCQPILLSNTLCGMTRGTPPLLQKLSSGREETQNQEKVEGEEKLVEQFHDKRERVEYSMRNLKERDILQLENSGYESQKPYKPKSVCDKLLAWYFGWDEHPHSD